MIDIEIYRDQLYKISELERFHTENEAKEAIYVFALNNRAAIYELSDGRFVLFTTLHQLEHYLPSCLDCRSRIAKPFGNSHTFDTR